MAAAERTVELPATVDERAEERQVAGGRGGEQRREEVLFQLKMNVMSAAEATPGSTSGRATRKISRSSPAPSTRQASMISKGTSRKNERIIHTATGRFATAP